MGRQQLVSRRIAGSQRFSVTFAKPGTYSYFCSLHPKMQGKVVVTTGD